MRIFAGIPFLQRTLEQATREVIGYAVSERQAAFHLVNAYSIAASSENFVYREVLERSEHNLPDGFPISFLTKFSSQPLTQVRGPSLFREVIEKSQGQGVKHFFLGSTDQVLDLLVSKVRQSYPNALIAGYHSPPFAPLTENERVEQAKRVIDSGANLIWVALGTPKQDIEAKKISMETGKTVVAVGAAFDFLAGTAAEAPRWMSKVGIEWIFRLMTEPKRLWRRYLIGNFRFIAE